MGYEDPHRWEGPSPPWSKVNVFARGASETERCWPISREERKVPEIAKLVGRLPVPRTIIRTSFKVKGKRSMSITTETDSVSYLPNGKAYELQNWYAIKACEIGFLHAGGAYHVVHTRRPHNLLAMYPAFSQPTRIDAATISWLFVYKPLISWLGLRAVATATQPCAQMCALVWCM